MQLRIVDGEPALIDTQIGLIRSLVISPNAPVVVDGAVLSSDNSVGYRTPHSATTKASSVGTTLEDISALTGQPKNTKYSLVKTTLDGEISSHYQELESAKEALSSAEKNSSARYDVFLKASQIYNDLIKNSENPASPASISAALLTLNNARTALEAANEITAKAREKKNEIDVIYTNKINLREVMEKDVQEAVDNLAYIKKDKNGLVFDKAFDGVYVIQFADGTEVVIHDSAAAGWTYQTFAHYIDPNNGVLRGYQSLGDETTVAQMPVSGTATYTGITTAYLNKQQVTAKVNAVADFAKKGVRFTTSDSQIHTLNGNVRTSTAADRLNMSGTASWAAGENAFKGNVTTADKALSGTFNGKFYGGASVAEIGGTYGLKNADNSQQLIGGYGAKRQ